MSDKGENADDPRAAKTAKGDPEILTIGRVNRLLEGLDEPTRQRVLIYLYDRHVLGPRREGVPPGVGPVAGRPVPSRVDRPLRESTRQSAG